MSCWLEKSVTKMDYNFEFNVDSVNHLNEFEDEEEFIMESVFYETSVNIFLLLIDVVSIFANCFVITTILRKRSSRSIVNAFIIAMAVNDLVLLNFNVIFVPIHAIFHFPKFNTTLCRIYGYFLHMANFLNVFLLAALITILSFFKSLRFRKLLIVIAIVFVTAIILATPNGYFSTVLYIDVMNKEFCFENWSNLNMELNVKTIQYLVQGSAFLLCAFICIVKYRSFRGDSEEIIRKLPFLILIEFFCWLPHFSITALEVFDSLFVTEYVIFYWVVYLIKASGVIVKPIFYLFSHEDLRTEIVSFLPLCFKKSPVVESYALSDNENM